MSGAKGFAITIAAQDRATSVIDKINRSIQGMQAPTSRLAGSLESLGKTTGITDIVGRLAGLTKGAAGAAKEIGRLGGLTGALGALASVGGVVALEDRFSGLALSIKNAGLQLGMMPSAVSRMNNAFKLLDPSLTAEGINSAFQSANDRAFGATMGQDGQLAQLLQAASGPNWRNRDQDAKTEIRDIGKLASRIPGNSPFAASKRRSLFEAAGIDPSLMPAAMSDDKTWDKAWSEAQKNGLTDGQINQGASLAKNIESLSQASDRLMNTIAAKMVPVADKLADTLKKMADAATDKVNKVGDLSIDKIQKILGDMIKKAEDLFPPLRDVIDILTSPAVAGIATPWLALVGAIGTLGGAGIGSFGMLGKALRAIGFTVLADQLVKVGVTDVTGSPDAGTIAGDTAGGAAAGGMIGSAIPVVGTGIGALLGGTIGFGKGVLDVMHGHTAQNAGAADDIVQGLQDKFHLTKIQSAALVGGFLRENAQLDPSLTDPSGKFLGIGQWSADRAKDYFNLTGKQLKDATRDQQVGFAMQELFFGKERGAGAELLAAKDEPSANKAIMDYLRPSPANRASDNLKQMTRISEILSRMNGGSDLLPKVDAGGNIISYPTDPEVSPTMASMVSPDGSGEDSRGLGDPALAAQRAKKNAIVPADALTSGPGRSPSGPIQLQMTHTHLKDGSVTTTARTTTPGVTVTTKGAIYIPMQNSVGGVY